MSFTVVSFHAHPDDETLLTGGTLARAAAEGHRVILVTATDGSEGLTSTAHSSRATLTATRHGELDAAAAALGIGEVVRLGYQDSGYPTRRRNPPSRRPKTGAASFASAETDEVAGRLAAIVRDAHADVLTGYDPAGGYGHPDHVKVHTVARRAAVLAGTPMLLEATVDRARLRWALRAARWVPGTPLGFRAGMSTCWTPRERLTHRIDVRDRLAAKRAAMRAHASQAIADDEARTLGFCLRLPGWLFARVFGYEWFSQPGHVAGPRLWGDIFASLR